MHLSKNDPLARAIDKIFGLKTPTATAIIERDIKGRPFRSRVLSVGSNPSRKEHSLWIV
jgi:hypothetical protein